jgi:hypothetical protein
MGGAALAAQTGMRTGVEDRHQKLVGALDHASHSLAHARESLREEGTAVAPGSGGSIQVRARAGVARVARLLEEAREPGRVAAESIEVAAHALDRELVLLADRHRGQLTARVIETRLEERDGGTWVTGLCPFCWERVAASLAPDGTVGLTRCPSGHRLAVLERGSAGNR